MVISSLKLNIRVFPIFVQEFSEFVKFGETFVNTRVQYSLKIIFWSNIQGKTNISSMFSASCTVLKKIMGMFTGCLLNIPFKHKYFVKNRKRKIQ